MRRNNITGLVRMNARCIIQFICVTLGEQLGTGKTTGIPPIVRIFTRVRSRDGSGHGFPCGGGHAVPVSMSADKRGVRGVDVDVRGGWSTSGGA